MRKSGYFTIFKGIEKFTTRRDEKLSVREIQILAYFRLLHLVDTFKIDNNSCYYFDFKSVDY